MNLRRILLGALLLVLVGDASRADARWPDHPSHAAPTVLNGTAGRGSWAGVPGIGPALPSRGKPALNPVVGSTYRSGHFVHPTTGRTRYTETVYDPTLGRFSRASFRR